MAEPPSIFAIFTDYDLDIKYHLKVKKHNILLQQHNICRVEKKRLFLTKKKKYWNLHPIIQEKTFNQRKSNYNIRNKCRTIDKHRPNSAPRQKNSNPLHLQIDFSDKLPHCGLL